MNYKLVLIIATEESVCIFYYMFIEYVSNSIQD